MTQKKSDGRKNLIKGIKAKYCFSWFNAGMFVIFWVRAVIKTTFINRMFGILGHYIHKHTPTSVKNAAFKVVELCLNYVEDTLREVVSKDKLCSVLKYAFMYAFEIVMMLLGRYIEADLANKLDFWASLLEYYCKKYVITGMNLFNVVVIGKLRMEFSKEQIKEQIPDLTNDEWNKIYQDHTYWYDKALDLVLGASCFREFVISDEVKNQISLV